MPLWNVTKGENGYRFHFTADYLLPFIRKFVLFSPSSMIAFFLSSDPMMLNNIFSHISIKYACISSKSVIILLPRLP